MNEKKKNNRDKDMVEAAVKRTVETPETAPEKETENKVSAVEETTEGVKKQRVEDIEPPAAKAEAAADEGAPARKTPGLTISLYVVGIIFLLIALFMLFTGVSYTRIYLASYEATFADMWSNSLQYVIGQFVPYLAYGVISLGLGKAIKEFNRGGVRREAAGPAGGEAFAEDMDKAKTEQAAQSRELTVQMEELRKEVEALTQITNIKFEETEKRQKVRLEDRTDSITAGLAELKVSRTASDEKILGQIDRLVRAFHVEDIEEEMDPDDLTEMKIRRERRFIK